LVGVTIFMANSRKNDQPNKLLAYTIKKSVWHRWQGNGNRKKGRRSNGIAKRLAGMVAMAGRKGQRDIAVGASLVKLTGDITERA